MASFVGQGSGKSKLQLQRLFDSESPLAEQLPTGLGFANARQVTFGSEIGGVGFPYHLEANGDLTILERDNYSLTVSLRFDRAGSSQVSELWFYIFVDGVQAGRSISYDFDKAGETHYLDFSTLRDIPSGTLIQVFIARDLNNSHNSGGLYRKNSSEPSLLNSAPCAQLRLDRFLNI